MGAKIDNLHKTNPDSGDLCSWGGGSGGAKMEENRVSLGIKCIIQNKIYPHVCGGTVNPITADYPRVCGGTVSDLSPRVRGNPKLWGSIPACAGEPTWTSIHCWRRNYGKTAYRIRPQNAGKLYGGASLIATAGVVGSVDGPGGWSVIT